MQSSRQKKTKSRRGPKAPSASPGGTLRGRRSLLGRVVCPSLEGCLDARLFKALSDPTRLGILLRLTRCPGALSVGEAAKCCSVDLSVVSRHLAVLRDAGVLSVEKHGRSVSYSVRYDQLTRTLRTLADAIDACCPADTKRQNRIRSRRPPPA